jgi:hypothetical protein
VLGSVLKRPSSVQYRYAMIVLGERLPPPEQWTLPFAYSPLGAKTILLAGKEDIIRWSSSSS